MLSVAVYSVFTAACGLSRGVTELAAFRFLLGLGMGITVSAIGMTIVWSHRTACREGVVKAPGAPSLSTA